MKRIEFDGTTYEFPDDFTDEEIANALRGDSLLDNTLDVAGEFANAANRAALQGLDFVGPGAVNAAARLSNEYLGTDFGQMPTLTGAFEENVPGAQGGFMEEGTARDITRAAGSTVPVAGALYSVPRNLGTLRGATEEFLGFGTQAPGVQAGAQIDDLVRKADDLSFPLSPGERYGSEPMRRLEASIESTPMPFNPMTRMKAARQDMLNRAAGESIGAPPGTRLTQENVGAIADDLSAEFRRLDLEDDLLVTQQFDDALGEVESTARTRLFRDPQVEQTVDQIMDKIGEGGRLPATEYQNLTSQLKAKIRQAYRGDSPDPEFADSLKEIVTALDDLAENNLDGAALARLRDARRKWKALSDLEKSRAVKESGDVSGPLLANYLRRTDKAGYGRGKNQSDLYNIARLTKAFPGQPDSGTASRMFIQNILQHPLAATLGGGATGSLAFQFPAQAAAAAAAVPLMSNAYFYGAPMIPGLARRAGALARVPGALEE